MTKKKTENSAGNVRLQGATTEFRSNEPRIKFGHPHEVLPKLLEVAQHFAESHVDLVLEPGSTEKAHGSARARLIFSNCAGSTAWGSAISELGLNPLIFRNCVAAGVNAAGNVSPVEIPAVGDARLIDVVAAPQGALSGDPTVTPPSKVLGELLRGRSANSVGQIH
jgi:hypothetical protein